MVAAVLALAGAAGRVLGAGVGGTEELTGFSRFTTVAVVAAAVVVAAVVVDEMDHAVLPSFVNPSFAS